MTDDRASDDRASDADPSDGVRPLRETLSQLRLRELLNEVQDRVEQIVEGGNRLDGLVEAMLAVTSARPTIRSTTFSS